MANDTKNKKLGCGVAGHLQGSNSRGECALVRKKGAEGVRARRTRRGPRPLPEQQPGTSPPSSTPAKRRRTPIEQLLRGGGGANSGHPRPAAARPGVSPRPGPGEAGGKGEPSARPAPARLARGRGLPGPPTLRAARSGALPRTAAWPEREAERSAAEAGPSLQASGRRLPSARPPAAGPARTPARPGLGTAASPHPGFIHRGTAARPAVRGRGPADKTDPPRPGRKTKS
ncbi:translation initiation factor IF-2-like [Orcinus orca]|uniref:translation initiation factor IF-2-like n=1 Tax=Orcinus orca TaxID=9733 RepID=UPI0021110498|nr:translation initiation factor IF-2-like [Orcinus orca]